MNLRERRFSIDSIPLLAVGPDRETRSVVLFFHGLHSSSETHLKELRLLAKCGYLALGVDGFGHGKRALDTREYLGLDPSEHGENRQIRKLLMASVWEIPYLVDRLQQLGYTSFACAGISWGGYLAYGAMVVEPRLRRCVSLLGCPDWHIGLGDQPGDDDPFSWSPHLYKERLLNRPVMAWNGEHDPHVPTKRVRQLAKTWKSPNFQYHEIPGVGHFPSAAQWDEVWKPCLQFLQS